MIGGVAAGLSRKLGIDPTVLRLAFVVFSVASGFGVALYMVAWLLVPSEGANSSIAVRALHDRRGIALALSFVPFVVIAGILGSALGAGWIGTLATPVCVGAGGFVLVWRNVEDEERSLIDRALRPLTGIGRGGKRSRRLLVLRVLAGLVVTAGGVVVLLAGANRAFVRPLGGAFLVIAGAVVIFGPWWLHVVRDLLDERQARALAEERADIAARIHDSVLQTLALIQRRSDQPQQVVKLARAQERELRSWLFEGHEPGGADDDTMLGTAVQRIQRDVEALHEVSVEAVVVGDCELDDGLLALVEAGREATVNAAKWSGAPVVSLFVEVEPDHVSMFVRDRGAGFDPERVAPDRRGLSESIHGRMSRHGGKAEVRSSPGQGTEVVLEMPRNRSSRARQGRL
jgi:signal transduction histidine kinase